MEENQIEMVNTCAFSHSTATKDWWKRMSIQEVLPCSLIAMTTINHHQPSSYTFIFINHYIPLASSIITTINHNHHSSYIFIIINHHQFLPSSTITTIKLSTFIIYFNPHQWSSTFSFINYHHYKPSSTFIIYFRMHQSLSTFISINHQ